MPAGGGGAGKFRLAISAPPGESFALSTIYARIPRGWPVSGDRIILITLRGDIE